VVEHLPGKHDTLTQVQTLPLQKKIITASLDIPNVMFS
jgi:hypothetical protein